MSRGCENKMLKKFIKNLIVAVPFFRTLYFKNYVYRKGLDEKIIRGRIQNFGHNIELCLSKNETVPSELLRELEFLIKEMADRQLVADEASEWAFQWLIMGKYGLKEIPQKAVECSYKSGTQCPLSDAIYQRRSVRQWTNEPVDRKAIEKIIDTAKWAPSSCNRQSWHVLLLEKKEDFEFISGYFPNEFYLNAQILLVIFADANLYGNNEKHFAYLDAGAFIQNLLLLLHAEGFGACWIGFKSWDCSGAVFSSDEHRNSFYNYFKLNSNVVPVSMVAVGRPATTPKAPPRQMLKNIILRHGNE